MMKPETYRFPSNWAELDRMQRKHNRRLAFAAWMHNIGAVILIIAFLAVMIVVMDMGGAWAEKHHQQQADEQ